jgi:hypothetical protein
VPGTAFVRHGVVARLVPAMHTRNDITALCHHRETILRAFPVLPGRHG